MIEPILNERMRNMSNFSFREKSLGIDAGFAVMDSRQPQEGTEEAGCYVGGDRIGSRGIIYRDGILSDYAHTVGYNTYNTRSSFYKGQAIRDDIKNVGKFMGQLISNSKNVWDSEQPHTHARALKRPQN